MPNQENIDIMRQVERRLPMFNTPISDNDILIHRGESDINSDDLLDANRNGIWRISRPGMIGLHDEIGQLPNSILTERILETKPVGLTDEERKDIESKIEELERVINNKENANEENI